ncbi:hypothetical protein AJ88_25645 [Mesorhizobium amorphae CCBAU 01583]|nr:hypothetical protein AJ88_25645 [Mesorhizobium amorphae CCBAU 01583]
MFAEKAIEQVAMAAKTAAAPGAKKAKAGAAAAIVPGGKLGAGFFDFMFKNLPPLPPAMPTSIRWQKP